VLFLHEIGELGVDEKVMLLRALEDKRFMPASWPANDSIAFGGSGCGPTVGSPFGVIGLSM